MSALTAEKAYKSSVFIKLGSVEEANMLKSCLEVDEELQPNKISKSFSIENSDLRM